jgi:hypothetical protein
MSEIGVLVALPPRLGSMIVLMTSTMTEEEFQAGLDAEIDDWSAELQERL